MQDIEGLTDRQAADAVRRCRDGTDALRLGVTDPGFDFPLWHDFRRRFLAHEAGHRCLATVLAVCKARGWLTARGTPRTEAPHVPAAMRTLPRVEGVLEARHGALHQLSDVAPAGVPPQRPPEWSPR
jgi:hypothetical protein